MRLRKKNVQCQNTRCVLGFKYYSAHGVVTARTVQRNPSVALSGRRAADDRSINEGSSNRKTARCARSTAEREIHVTRSSIVIKTIGRDRLLAVCSTDEAMTSSSQNVSMSSTSGLHHQESKRAAVAPATAAGQLSTRPRHPQRAAENPEEDGGSEHGADEKRERWHGWQVQKREDAYRRAVRERANQQAGLPTVPRGKPSRASHLGERPRPPGRPAGGDLSAAGRRPGGANGGIGAGIRVSAAGPQFGALGTGGRLSTAGACARQDEGRGVQMDDDEQNDAADAEEQGEWVPHDEAAAWYDDPLPVQATQDHGAAREREPRNPYLFAQP